MEKTKKRKMNAATEKVCIRRSSGMPSGANSMPKRRIGLDKEVDLDLPRVTSVNTPGGYDFEDMTM